LITDPAVATKTALRRIARRCKAAKPLDPLEEIPNSEERVYKSLGQWPKAR